MKMEIITWDVDNTQETVEMLDKVLNANRIIKAVDDGAIESDLLPTEVAITICKTKLIGEYHGLLVKQKEEYLEDSEIYVLTWQGEASEHGEMYRLDVESLYDIINEFEKNLGTAD